MHWHKRILFGGVLLVIIAALLNRGGGPLMSHLILTVVTFLIVVSAFFLRKHFESKSLNVPEIFLIGFLIFFLVSFFFSRTPNYGINELLLFSNATILILLIRRSGILEKDIEYFKTGLVFVALAEAIAGIFIYTKFAYPRFGGTFIDLGAPYTSFANDFANFSLLLLPLCFEKFFRAMRVGEKVMYGLIAGIVFAGFLLSFSRGGWIAFAFAMLIWGIWFLIIHRKNIREHIKGFLVKTVILVIITVGIVTSVQLMRGLVFPVNTFWGKATLTEDEGGASIKERLNFWRGALHIIGERPVLGNGILSFRFLYPEYQPDFGANWDHPHNMVLKIGVENGLPAALLFLGFLITFAWKFIKESKRLVFILPLMIGALASFGHNLVDYNYIVSNFTLFAVFLGIGIAMLSGGKFIFRSPSKIPITSLCLVGSLLLTSLALNEGFFSLYFKSGRIALGEGDTFWAQHDLEESKKLIFDRDLYVYLSALYQKQDATGKERGIPTMEFCKDDCIYADVLNRLGEVELLKTNDRDRAHAYFSKALARDSKNRFRYYYNFFTSAAPKENLSSMKNTVQTLLKEYETVLRKNSHFTILTDNPQYAIKLYDYFSDPRFQPISENAKKSANRLRQIWLREIEKYVKKYGPLPEPAPL